MDDTTRLTQNDTSWWLQLAAQAELLAHHDTESGALWPVDDLLADKRYVPCPRRGTHQRLTECWLCWCDVAWGYCAAADVLAPGG